MISHSLEGSLVAIQLNFDLVEFFDLLVVAFRLVANERAVKVNGEDQEDHTHRDHDDGGGKGRLPATVWADLGGSSCCRYFFGVKREEFDPAEQNHLSQKEEDSQGRGKAPRQLNVVVHALVRWLADRVQIVDVADGLHVGQNAGANQQSKKMHRHQNGCANAEGD